MRNLEDKNRSLLEENRRLQNKILRFEGESGRLLELEEKYNQLVEACLSSKFFKLFMDIGSFHEERYSAVMRLDLGSPVASTA